MMTEKKVNILSSEQLVERDWEMRLSGYENARNGKGGSFLQKLGLLVGICMPFILYALHLKSIAVVAALIFCVIVGGSLLSLAFKSMLEKAAAWLSKAVGTGMTWLLLAPIYWIGFSFVRFLQWIAREDRMLLKSGASKRSMWLQADLQERKAACDLRMYCSEKLSQKGGILMKFAVLGLLVFLGGEVFLRSKGYHKPLLYMNDVYAGYRIQPNQHVCWEGGEVFINNHGMRNRYDINEEKPDETFRVLLIGDSTLYGNDDLPQDVIYSERLEKLLSADAGGRRVEVLNWGVNAAGPDQNYGMLRRYPHAFSSDIVLVCVPLLDVYRPKQDITLSRRQMNRPYLAWETVAVYYLPEFRAWFNKRTTYKTVSNPTFDSQELMEEGIKAYISLVKTAESSGSESWIEILPQIFAGIDADKGQITNGDYLQVWEYLQRETSTNGIIAYLPLAVFKGKGKASDVWHDPAHLGPQGHKYYADYLFRQIEKNSSKWNTFKNISKEGKQ